MALTLHFSRFNRLPGLITGFLVTGLLALGLHYHLTKSLIHISGLLALICLTAMLWQKRSIKAITPARKAFALSLLSASLMVFLNASSGVESVSSRLIDSYAIPAICLALATITLKPLPQHWLNWLLPASLLAMAIPGVVDFLQHDSLAYRTDGNLNMPLVYATCLTMMIVATSASFALSQQHNNVRFVLLNVTALAAGGSALVMTGGRGPMLALAVTLVVFFAILGMRFLRWRTTVTVGLLVTALAAVAISQSQLPQRFSLAYEEIDEDSLAYTSSGLRLLMWQGAVEIIRQQPLSGVGIGQHNNFFQQAQQQGNETIHPRARVFDHLHNDTLNALAWFGIPGAIVYLLPFWLPLLMFGRQLQKSNDSRALIGLLVGIGFLLSGLTNAPSVRAATICLYWLIAALCLPSNNHQSRSLG